MTNTELIIQSNNYVSRLKNVMQSIYMGEYVTVKHRNAENTRAVVDTTGEICYIHSDNAYFNVKFDNTGTTESYYPSDILEGVVKLHSEGRFDR